MLIELTKMFMFVLELIVLFKLRRMVVELELVYIQLLDLVVMFLACTLYSGVYACTKHVAVFIATCVDFDKVFNNKRNRATT